MARLIQEIMDLIERADYPAALKALNGAIAEAPAEKLPEYYSLRGFVHLKNLDFSRAEADCSEAIDQNWNEAQTYAWRAAARGEQNKWKLAFDDLDQACAIAGNDRDQYLELMSSYAQTASDYFREQIKFRKTSADLFFERGWIYFRCGNYPKAERDFQMALEHQPNHPWASLGMSELLVHFENFNRVDQFCKAALKGDVTCQQHALKLLVKYYRYLGNLDAAQQTIDQLWKLAGDEPQELMACARLRSELGDPVKALDELNEILKKFPDLQAPLLLRGDCFRDIHNFNFAIEEYTQFLRFQPQDVPALLRRAQAYLEARKFSAAHADLDEIIKLDDTLAELFLVRSKVYREEGNLQDALTACRRSVRLDNRQAEVFAVQASIYQRLGEYANAIEEFSRSIELAEDPAEQGQYYYLRGNCYYEIDEFDKARSDFKKSCKRRPFHAGGWIWKAATCARQEKWADAILGLQQAILVRPSASEQYQKLGQPVAEKAIEYFRRQHQRGDNSVALFRNRGLAYQFLGHDPEAIVDYSTVLHREPDDVETLIRRGQVYTRLGDHVAADRDFSKIIQLDSSNHLARYSRALVRRAEGKLAEAKADLQQAIKVAPDHPRYHMLLGELSEQSKDQHVAVAAYDRAIRQDSSNPLAYRRRGELHFAAGRTLQAISDFTHCLELNPSQLDVLVERGYAYLKTGQPTMAIEDFELALTHNDRLHKAYSGRAAALLPAGKHEYALIWLTKAFHRFEASQELAEVVFARGKVFFQMGRALPAIADFTAVMELRREHPHDLSAARLARGIAEVHAGQFSEAEHDFRKLADEDPSNEKYRAALRWLNSVSLSSTDPQTPPPQAMPAFLNSSATPIRPTRPPVVRNGVALSAATMAKWEVRPLYDSWVVRTAQNKEYGPVPLVILNTWATEGRLDVGMKILRADWSKWKRLEKILTEVTPTERVGELVEEFPEIDTGRISARNISE